MYVVYIDRNYGLSGKYVNRRRTILSINEVRLISS
jgi:hypothetical protein